ncbi:thiamine thiazole synthase, chloroplastic-like protein [Tanacetum coccineum]
MEGVDRINELMDEIWIRYAITRNVEDVDLWLQGVGVGQKEFTFEDELFFKTSCITRMTLTYCQFNPPNDAISWERLECLCLYYVTLDEDMIEKISSGSPCLESLELKNCHGYRRIDDTSRSVKKLVFSYYYYRNEEDYIDCIKINAPYISSLTIKGEVEVELVLLDVSSLIKAELDYCIDPGMSDDMTHEEMLRGLLESFDHVKDVISNDFWRRPMSSLCLGCRYSLETSLLNSRDSDVATDKISWIDYDVRWALIASRINSIHGLELDFLSFNFQ